MIDFLPTGKVLFDIELKGTTDKPLSLNTGLIQHMESTLNENMEEIPISYHRFVTQQVDIVDKSIKSLMADGTPLVRWRIGFVTEGKSMWLPWQEHQIVHCSAMIKGLGNNAGHNFEISTADRLFTVNRSTKILSRKGKISDMVKQMASDAGVEAVVEPTVGTFAYIQVNESDVEFINRRLVHRCLNDKGRGQYLLYMRDNVLHFHTPDYQTEIKEIAYFDTPFKGMVQNDRSQQLFDVGIAGTRCIAYDPYTGQTNEVVSDPEKYLRLADGIYRMDKVPNGVQTMTYHLSQNEPQEVSALAQNVYSFGRAKTFEISADLTRSMNIRVGDILRFVLSPQKEKTSPWSGYYIVAGVCRTVAKETLRTLYTLRRGEIVQDRTTVTQPNTASQLIPETTAPGQDINPSVTQNSILTVGAGKQESSTVYATVEDAQKLPGT